MDIVLFLRRCDWLLPDVLLAVLGLDLPALLRLCADFFGFAFVADFAADFLPVAPAETRDDFFALLAEEPAPVLPDLAEAFFFEVAIF